MAENPALPSVTVPVKPDVMVHVVLAPGAESIEDQATQVAIEHAFAAQNATSFPLQVQARHVWLLKRRIRRWRQRAFFALS